MQGFDPQTILPRIAAQGLERQEIRPGDWFDDDGMLMCGKCGEPRQGMVTVSAPMEGNPENKMTFKATRSCKCDRDKEAAEKQAEQNKKDMERVARLKKASLMDEKLREASFDSFQVTKYNARNLKLCRRYAEAFDEMVSKNQGLIFWGSVGTGKSFAAACIANHLLNRGVPVMMTSLVKLLELIQGGEEKESDIIARMNSAKLVIFDDLGAERNTDYALEKIYNIIDSRYRRKLPMLLTTNLTIDEMKDEEDRRYSRIYDRIFETCYSMQFTGPSWKPAGGSRRWRSCSILTERRSQMEMKQRVQHLIADVERACIKYKLNMTIYDGKLAFVDQESRHIVATWGPQFKLSEEPEHGGE